MKALILLISLLFCVFLPCANPFSDEEISEPRISSVVPEIQVAVLNQNPPIPGVLESGVDVGKDDSKSESRIKNVTRDVRVPEVPTTWASENEERTLESPPKSEIRIRRLDDMFNGTGTDGTDLIKLDPIPYVFGNDLDNTTINAEESIHNTYTAHPQPHSHAHAHSLGSTAYGNPHAHNVLPQQHHSHVTPLKESVVHRNPHDHFNHYDAIRTHDHDSQSPHHPQPNYGHHLHGGGHGQQHNSHNGHSHAHGRGYGSFQPYHYDTHDIPECAQTRHYHNVTYCLEDHYYPKETILWAIQQSGHYARRLLSDVTYQSADNLVDGLTRAEEERMTYSHYYGPGSHQQHHQLDKYKAPWSGYSYNQDYYKNGGYLCPSNIYYGRPRRAMNTYGKWKVIVNLADHHPPKHSSGHGHGHSHHHPQAYTQTIRLEHCIYANSPCSYVDSHYYSRCLQKHNFVKLVAWTYEEGLHVDNFKLPIACSCHVQQPSHYYTPQPHHKHHQTPVPAYAHGQQHPGQAIHASHAQLLNGIHQGKQKIINSLLG